jgi:hypothetical protein
LPCTTRWLLATPHRQHSYWLLSYGLNTPGDGILLAAMARHFVGFFGKTYAIARNFQFLPVTFLA